MYNKVFPLRFFIFFSQNLSLLLPWGSITEDCTLLWCTGMGNNNKLHKYNILHRSLTGCCSINHNKISVIDWEKLKASVYLPIHQAVITTVSWHWYRKLKNIRNGFVLNNTDWECQRVGAEGHNYKMLWLKSLISASQGTCWSRLQWPIRLCNKRRFVKQPCARL